ncbi:alanine/glycine:cation symporter family protein [Leucobacter albus]|uniref:Alanine/glycine:cation symporter family protein n=1 Tax=Leucobacter albus TaxID=272210 RepID=A0ABW3TM47_9MICO
MQAISDLIAEWGDQFWTWLVLPIVVALGLYLTIRSGVVQFRLIPEMFRTLTDATPKDENGAPQSVSAFQAFTISAASRVGVGNIAGVGTAIAVGGPGAVFWMWLMAFIGGASSFVESSLAQLYKTKDETGFRGGPAYYMERGLGARWMGVLFSVVLVACFPIAFSSLQANTIQATLAGTLGEQMPGWLPLATGCVLAALMAAVIFGGVRRIASVTQTLVPLMALLYLLLGLIIVALNVREIPGVFATIFTSAFGAEQFTGAALGYVILTGIKRGMFSNEAGLGSAPNAGASAAVTHPVKQGLVQTLGVYFDTFLICSITAFIVLVAAPDLAGAAKGIELTQSAISTSLGPWANVLLTVIIFLLAFSSILGNYYYGESNIEFLRSGRAVLTGYRVVAVVAVFAGALVSADIVWNLADGVMGIMALINLVAIALLSGVAFKLLRDYSSQRRSGKDPVFTRDRLPELRGVEQWADERSVTGPISTTARI